MSFMFPGVINRLKSPDWWGWAILSVFLFVFPILWHPYFRNPYEIIRAAASLLVVAAFLLIIAASIIRQHKIIINNKTHVVSSLLFLGYVLIHYFTFKGADDFLLTWLACTILISIFISLNGYGCAQFQLLSIISYSSIIPNIYGIVQFFGIDFPMLGNYGTNYNYGYRAFSFFGNPNFYGSYLVVMIPVACFCFYMSCIRRRKIPSFIHGSALILALLALIASQTRTAMLTLGFGILFIPLYAVVRHPAAKPFSIKAFAKRLIIPNAIVVIVYVILLASIYFIHRIYPSIGMWSKVSVAERIALFKSALLVTCQHPLFGNVLGYFSSMVHNFHLETLSSYGSVGYVLWMIVFINALVVAIKRRTLLSCVMATTLFLLILIDGIASVGMRVQAIALYCWILMGLICTNPVVGAEYIIRVEWKLWKTVAALILVAIIAIGLVNHGRKILLADHLLAFGLGTYTSGRYKISLMLLSRAVELNPRSKTMLYWLAKAKLGTGDIEGAKNSLEILLLRDKEYNDANIIHGAAGGSGLTDMGYKDANLMLGNILYGQSNYVGASDCFKRHVSFDNTSWSAYYGLAMSYNRQGNHKDAIATGSIITNSANAVSKEIMVGTYRCLSMSYYSVGDKNAALNTIDRAVELDATNTEITEQKRQLEERIKADTR